MAYFDNAATTYPKPECVYDFMDKFYRENGGSAGRGHYALAQTAGELIADTRARIKNLLHCPAKKVIFTPTATIALNIIIQGIVKEGVKNVYIQAEDRATLSAILQGSQARVLQHVTPLIDCFTR